jgi:serine/threonine protein kinase
MQQDDWARLKELFQEAIALPMPEQSAFLEGAALQHPQLATSLRELLASHAEPGGFLERPVLTDVCADDETLAQADALHAGDLINDTYEVQSRLGAGGMGVVYRVLHRGLQRTFAAKVIHADVAGDDGFLGRFEREAVALGRLKHPNIVDVTDYGVERAGAQRPYLIMECLEGITLGERLRSGPLTVEAAMAVFEGVAAALDYAHSQGVLHLDLKPANVSLHHDSTGAMEVRILDFGLAQFTAHEADADSRESPLAGTPAYLAPELLDGKAPGTAADIYAFGVLMYETLAGRPPFEGSIAEVLEQQRRAAPPLPSGLNPTIPASLDGPLLEFLAKDPAARPATAEAALSRLRGAVLRDRQRTWRRREIPRRTFFASVVGVVFGALSPLLTDWSPVQRLEWLTVDARYAIAPPRGPSGNVVLLMLDDASLAQNPVSPVQQADTFGRDLQRIMAAGASGVAVDFLLPEAWSESAPFTRLVLEHAERLTLAAYSDASGKVLGPECIAGPITFVLGPERAAALFGFINFDEDADGVSRVARLFFRDSSGGRQPSFAAQAAQAPGMQQPWLHASIEGERFWVDHRIDPARFTRVSWKDLDGVLQNRPDLFRNRIVLAGADYAASGDVRRVPVHDRVPGVAVHAAAVETILGGFPIRSVGRRGLIVLSALGSALLCGAALLLRRTSALLAIAAVSFAWIATALVLFARSGVMVPGIVPLALALAGTAAGLTISRWAPPYPTEAANRS